MTEDWVFCSHRLALAVAAKKAGYDIYVVANETAHGDQIRGAGLTLIPINLVRKSMNPVTELGVLWQLMRIFRNVRPDIVHNVAIKPIIYGSLAARLTGIRNVVNALTGMGYIFISGDLKARILRPLIEFLFGFTLNRKGSQVIFQNTDDCRQLVMSGIVDEEKITIIRGSGVDISVYSANPPPNTDAIMVILPSRMLWDKGVGEFVEAARHLKSEGINARFILVGGGDPHNPAAVPDETLAKWADDGIVEWWGHREDMPAVIASSHIVCLPSYREGLPKALIEAASCARPIVTTDVPGCREIVEHGVNGLLVKVRDAQELTEALRTLINDSSARERMGEKGRDIVEQGYTIEKVIDETLHVYERCTVAL